MTVSYTGDVANSSTFGCFNKIMGKWRGSVYKLVYKELLAYISCYFVINMTYRMIIVPKSECNLAFDGDTCMRWKTHRELFEQMRLYISVNLKQYPLTFVLGFYVSLIIKRWWTQYELLPWPDRFGMLATGLFAAGTDTRGRLLRRNMIRYVTLSYCIALRTVSFRLKKRFPTMDHLVHAGVMRQDELEHFKQLEGVTTANKWFLPLVWAAKMISQATEEGMIPAPAATAVMSEVGRVRGQLQELLSYDWLSVPLVYTQTVTLAVYFYFLAALFGTQWVTPASSEAYEKIYKTYGRFDMFFPFFVTLEFAFYVGWLKVAETLINPFGEDDDDFELNRLLDRHIQVGYMICDPSVQKPDLLKDKFWESVIPKEMLYSVGSEGYGKLLTPEFRGSAEVALDDKLEGSETGYGETTYNGGGVSELMRRRVSNTTLYESIRTQGRVSRASSGNDLINRASSGNDLIKSVLTRAQLSRVASVPPATPPRPKEALVRPKEALTRSDEALTRNGVRRGAAVSRGGADCPVGAGQSCTTSRGKAGTRQEEITRGKMGISLKGAHSEYSSAEMRETYSGLDEKNRF